MLSHRIENKMFVLLVPVGDYTKDSLTPTLYNSLSNESAFFTN